MLALDGGDLLFKTAAPVPTADPGEAKARAALVARVMAGSGIGAVNVGRRDLAAGLPFLEDLGRDPGVPWVASNLRRAAGTFPFPRWRVLPWAGQEVAVLGVLPPDPRRDAALGIEVLDPVGSLRETLAELPPVAAIVCLSNLGLEGERKVARELPAIGMIVGGGEVRYVASPPVEGDTVILYAADRGRFLGVLDVPERALAAWRAPQDRNHRAILQSRLDVLGSAPPASGPGSAEGAAAGHLLQRQQVEAAIAAFDAHPATFANQLLPLDASVPDDLQVAQWVVEQKRLEGRAVQRVRRGPRPPTGAAEQPFSGPFHLGTAGCKDCHREAYRAWMGTPHARSYEPLKGAQRSVECLQCHAARVRRPAGVSIEPVVGCEVCHGPGGNHRGKGNIARRPPESVCAECHRGQHGSAADFDVRAGYRAVRCDRGGPARL